MIKIRSATRMALSIGVGCACLIWGAVALGLISDPSIERSNSRVSTTRALAVNVATFAENRGSIDLKRVLERAVANDPNIRSVGVQRNRSDRYLMTFGPHKESWQPGIQNIAEKQIDVEILANKKVWGNLQVSFEPYSGNALAFAFPFGLLLFAFGASSLFSWLILARSLRYLNPSKVVPGRVRSALDTLAEGLVLLDGNGEIAHANESFYQISSAEEGTLLGKQLGSLGWKKELSDAVEGMPWEQCLETQQRVSRHILSLRVGDTSIKKFAVNATPILGSEQSVRGVLVSFDDVTALENKNAELAKIIGSLRSSRDEVARQNERLNFLASYDPLTKCMNRRSFFIEFERLWANEDCPLLNLMILDVDHFKGINDTHGHSVGDEVLVLMGHLLRKAVGDRGIVCRYGGEEFVVLVPGITVDQCEGFGKELRQLIENSNSNGVKFTVSIGLSCRDFIPMDAQHLLDQADESLYLAKDSGRNKLVRFDNRLRYKELIENAAIEEEQSSEIPYSAVTGLLSALSFRCPRTAEHSIRVADMCVVVGEKLMNRRELYQLEVAALLHDIGKIGVPDSILHKPGPLTDEEWVVMRKHDEIGAEIVRSALSSEQIAHFIESHHKFPPSGDGGADTVFLTPLVSRVITVCDAFDAMVTDRVYREALPVEEALTELERNTAKQFDPQVVSLLCAHIRSGIQSPTQEVVRPVFSSKQAANIGRHIEELYKAVHDEDIERLKEVVQQLREDTSGNSQVNDVANKIDDAIEDSSGDDLEKVLNLANEVMQICRDSRNTFVDAAESIVGKN